MEYGVPDYRYDPVVFNRHFSTDVIDRSAVADGLKEIPTHAHCPPAGFW
jgi:hypothetical protein